MTEWNSVLLENAITNSGIYGAVLSAEDGALRIIGGTNTRVTGENQKTIQYYSGSPDSLVKIDLPVSPPHTLWSTNYYGFMALDSLGYPHIVYCRRVPYQTAVEYRYIYQDSTGWHNWPSALASGVSDDSLQMSIAVAGNGTVHVSYYSSNRSLNYAVKTSGGDWQHETVDATGTDIGMYNCICLDSEGNPHIAYRRSKSETGAADNKVCYAVKQNGTWTRSDIATGLIPYTINIVLDENNKAHVLYAAYETDYTLNYETNATGSWVRTNIATTSSSYNTYSMRHFLCVTKDDVHCIYSEQTASEVPLTGKIFYCKKSDAWEKTVLLEAENHTLGHLGLFISDNCSTYVVYRKSDKSTPAPAIVDSFNLYYALADPLPPTPLTLSASAESYTEISLVWEDVSENEEGFKIERSLSEDTGFEEISIVAANTETYLDSELACGTRYYYRIRAYNSAGTSEYSNIASAETPAPTTYFPSKSSPEDRIYYLPQWMKPQSLDTVIRQGTMYYKTLFGSLPELDTLLYSVDILSGQRTLSDSTLYSPRLLFVVPSNRYSGVDTVSVKTAADSQATSVRRARSVYDFQSASDPVFIESGSVLYLRNLAVVEYTELAEGKVLDLSDDPPVEDESIWVYTEAGVERLPNECFDRETNIVTFPEEAVYRLYYSSSNRLAALSDPSVYINDNPPLTPTPLSFWNIFDESALLAGITRFDKETNVELRERIRCAFKLMGEGSSPALVGQSLGLLGYVHWDGKSALDLPYPDITHVIVQSVPKSVLVRGEKLIPSFNRKVFASSKKLWDDGYIVYINGMQVTDVPFATGGVIEFDDRQPGEVSATYSYTNYTLDASGGYVSRIAPTVNLTEGEYTILYLRGLRAYFADDSSYMAHALVMENGEATQSFLELARLIKASIPITVGAAQWGEKSYWFESEETLPVFSNLPIVYK